jgi:outer membrane protein TolC
MTLTTAMAVALFLGQTPADNNPPPGQTAQPAQSAQPTLPADATGPVITLDEALKVAGERNLDLQALSAQLDQAKEITWKAFSFYLPQVTVSASTQRQKQLIEPIFGPPPTPPALVQGSSATFFQAEVDQTLISARLFFAIDGARKSQQSAVLSLDNGRRQVLFGVARAYYGAASLKELLGVSQRLLEIAQRQEHDAQVRYTAGAVAKVTLIRAQIDRARAEEDLKRARAAYLSAKVALAALLARDTAFEVTGPPSPTLPEGDLDALVTQAVKARPDVEAARIQIGAERANRNAVLGGYLPDIQGFAKWQWENAPGLTGGKGNNWVIGVQGRWVILDGFLRESNVREANAKIREANARADGAVVRTRQEVTTALLDLESARANAQKSKEQRDLAAENQRLVDVSFRAGTATAVEQADATAQLRNAEIQVATDNLNAQLAALNVLNAIGSFNPRSH